jgi:hypothetical protein
VVFKITASAGPRDSTAIAFDGDLRVAELAVLSEAIGKVRMAGGRVLLDLTGVQVVDRAAMRQLREWLDGGIEIKNSPAYLSAWMEQERKSAIS